MSQTIALVAHDARKDDLVDWASHHETKLARLAIYATGTTGQRLIDGTGLEVTRLKSGPMGGDAQLGALIAEGALDGLIFFIDPLIRIAADQVPIAWEQDLGDVLFETLTADKPMIDSEEVKEQLEKHRFPHRIVVGFPLSQLFVFRYDV